MAGEEGGDRALRSPQRDFGTLSGKEVTQSRSLNAISKVVRKSSP